MAGGASRWSLVWDVTGEDVPVSPVSLPVHLEVPTPWLESPRDGDRNRLMFNALQKCVRDQAHIVSCAEIPFGTSFSPKVAPDGGFRIAYHSCGDSRHVWRLKETPVPYFYSFDRLGFSGWSEAAVRRERLRAVLEGVPSGTARDWCGEMVRWLDGEGLSKYRQEGAGDVPAEPFVFFPLQVRRDVVAPFARIDPLVALREAARAARRQRVPLVVKRHPFCTSRIVAAALRSVCVANPWVIVTDAPVNRLLASCGSVLLSNSGVGIEALLRGRPVHAFGRSEYEVAISPVDRPAGVAGAFRFGEGQRIDTGYRFAWYYLRRMCFDCRNPESVALQIRFAEYCVQRDVWCEEERDAVMQRFEGEWRG